MSKKDEALIRHHRHLVEEGKVRPLAGVDIPTARPAGALPMTLSEMAAAVQRQLAHAQQQQLIEKKETGRVVRGRIMSGNERLNRVQINQNRIIEVQRAVNGDASSKMELIIGAGKNAIAKLGPIAERLLAKGPVSPVDKIVTAVRDGAFGSSVSSRIQGPDGRKQEIDKNYSLSPGSSIHLHIEKAVPVVEYHGLKSAETRSAATTFVSEDGMGEGEVRVESHTGPDGSNYSIAEVHGTNGGMAASSAEFVWGESFVITSGQPETDLDIRGGDEI